MENKIAEYGNIGLVIVLFHPTEEDKSNVERLLSTYKGIAVDNTIENKGIAEAQNIGIRQLLKNKDIQYIVFLDQDSRTNISYPADMVEEYERISTTQNNLALLGPTVDHLKTGEEYHSVIHKDKGVKESFIPRRDVISSGSVVVREVLEKVGLNEEALFIDFVDFDWCWRAEAQGLVCGITQNVHISHQVGSRELSLGGYKVIVSAPMRYYYQYRNHLWLCRRGYVPMQWKLANGIKHLARLVYFPLFVKGGGKCWKYMWKGIAASFSSPQKKKK